MSFKKHSYCHNTVGDVLYDIIMADTATYEKLNDIEKIEPERRNEFYGMIANSSTLADTLQYVPNKYKTYELCLLSVNINGYNLRSVPAKLKTEDICLAAIAKEYHTLRYIPWNLKTTSFYIKAVSTQAACSFLIPQTKVSTWLELIKNFEFAYEQVEYPTKEMTTLHKMLWEI